MPDCPVAPYPQPPNSSLTDSSSGWTSTSTGWSLTLTQSNTAQDNRGILVNAPGQPDYYQCIDNTITCNVSLGNDNGNMTVTATVDIKFYSKIAMQEMQDNNWIEQNVTQNFDLLLTFTSGDNGTIVITPTITPSPLPAPSGSAPILGSFAKVGAALSSTLTAKYNSLGTNITAMVNKLTSDFANNIGNDMNVLGNQFVLPAGDVFYYNSLLFDTEDDMQVNIASAK